MADQRLGLSPDAQTGALAGVWLAELEQDLVDTDRLNVPLDNADGISTTGHTGIRLHVSGGEPTGKNSVCLAAFDDTSLPEPRLAVTYYPDVPIVE